VITCPVDKDANEHFTCEFLRNCANHGGPSRFRHLSLEGFRGHSTNAVYWTLERSLSALWVARYPDSRNERKRVLRVLR
jgi:hypothetical protein